jgi:hypothetical protein
MTIYYDPSKISTEVSASTEYRYLNIQFPLIFDLTNG